MAASVKQERNVEASNATNVSLAFSTNTVAGNAIHVFTEYFNSTAPTSTTVTDTSNSYPAVVDQCTGAGSNVWNTQTAAFNIVGGADTVKVTFSASSGSIGIWIAEIQGTTTTGPDSHNGSAIASSSTPSLAMTLVASGALIHAMCENANTGTAVTAGSGWTLGLNSGWLGGNPSACATSESQHFATSGSKSATFSISADTTSILMMGFADGGAAATDAGVFETYGVMSGPGVRPGIPTSKLRSPVLDTGTTPRPFVDQTAGFSSRFLWLGTPVSKLRSGNLDTGTTPPLFIDQTAGWSSQPVRLGTPLSRLRGGNLDTGTTPPPFIDQTAGWSPRFMGLGTPWSRLRNAYLDTGTTPPLFIDQTAGWAPRFMWLGTPFSRLRSGNLDTGTTSATQRFIYTPTGGKILGGTGTPLRYEDYAPTGGKILGGTGTPIRIENYAPSGGKKLGGTAGPVIRIENYTPSGGKILGGTGSPINVRQEGVRSGGLVKGGSAGYSTHVSTLIWVASGGKILGGAANVQFIHAGGPGAQLSRKFSGLHDLVLGQ